MQVTPAWLSELQRVIELDPHTVGGRQRGVDHPPAGRLPGTHDGASDGIEAVRVHLHRLGYVCKRPTWSLKRKSTEQAGWVKKGPSGIAVGPFNGLAGLAAADTDRQG